MRIEGRGRATGQAARITELWAWTVVDPINDTEGIIAVTLAGRSLPCIGATRSIVAQYEPFARQVAREIETEPTLRRFVAAEESNG